MFEVSFVILIGLFFVFMISYEPFTGLFLFTVMLYVKPGIFSTTSTALHLTRLVGVFTLIALFFHAGKKGGIKFFDTIQSKWLIALGVVMCLSMATSIWRGNTFAFLANFFKIYVAFFLIINLVLSIKRYRAVVWAMVASMLYIGLGSIGNYYRSGDSVVSERMFGAYSGALFSDPNDMAMGFIMLLPFLYYDLFRGNAILRKVALLATIGIFLCGIVLTESRGGFLGMAAMLFVLWLRSRKKITMALIAIFLLIVGWHITPQSYKERMVGIKTAVKEDAAALSRLDAWKAGWNMMTQRAFGVGPGNFGEGFVQYRPPDAVDFSGMRRVAHNMFVEVGGETGFVGLVVFVFMIGSTFVALNRVKKRVLKEMRTAKEAGREIILLADATFLSLIGYCASGMFLSQAYNFVLYYLIGFSVVLERLEKVRGEA